MRLRIHHSLIAVAVLVAAIVVVAGPANATPQFAAVGQALADKPAQAQNVTYYYRHGWGHRPYVHWWHARPSYNPHYYAPRWHWGRSWYNTYHRPHPHPWHRW